jgi:hypothetical protein
MAPTSMVLRLHRIAAGIRLFFPTTSALSVHCNAPLRTGSCGALRRTDTSDEPKLFPRRRPDAPTAGCLSASLIVKVEVGETCIDRKLAGKLASG